jgi:hypothetical protein
MFIDFTSSNRWRDPSRHSQNCNPHAAACWRLP